jgi:hypothetical protein
MASGGSGMVTKPTLFLAGEGGREEYAFSGTNKSLSTSGGITIGSVNVTVQVAEGDDPKKVADVVLEAMRTQATLYQGIGVIADRRIAAA